MNKSVMKCCICNNENIGEFITINDKKYHLCCIKQLQQENKKYKEIIDKAIEFIYAHSSMEPPYYEFREFYNASNLSELLDILKEVE